MWCRGIFLTVSCIIIDSVSVIPFPDSVSGFRIPCFGAAAQYTTDMTSVHIVETSVNDTNNSPSRDHTALSPGRSNHTNDVTSSEARDLFQCAFVKENYELPNQLKLASIATCNQCEQNPTRHECAPTGKNSG